MKFRNSTSCWHLLWEYSNRCPLECRPKTSVTDFCLLEIWRHTVWCKDSIISENPAAVFVTSGLQPWTYTQYIHSKYWWFSTRKGGVKKDSNNNRNYLTSLDETHCSRPKLNLFAILYYILSLTKRKKIGYLNMRWYGAYLGRRRGTKRMSKFHK